MTAEIVNATLLYDPRETDEMYSVLSFRDRAYRRAMATSVTVGEASAEIIADVDDGRLTVVTDRKPGIPTCLLCGCSSDIACEDGCFWVRAGLCSKCV